MTEDILERQVDSNGHLYTKRLISKTNPCPKWAEKFISVRSLLIIEESIVDPVGKTLTTYTRNIGCKNYMTIDEKLVYKQSLRDQNETIAQRSAWIESNFGYGMSRAVVAFGMERFKKNIAKATLGFQMVLNTMYDEKVDEIAAVASEINLKSFHPWLKKQLMERARTLSNQVAASKAKVPPVLVQAACRSV